MLYNILLPLLLSGICFLWECILSVCGIARGAAIVRNVVKETQIGWRYV